MESFTPPNTTTTPSVSSENVTSSTSSQSNTTFSFPSTTSAPLSTPRPFFIPLEKDKEKPLVPGIISFPVPSKLFGDTGGAPFKISIFDLPKAFSGTKESGSANLFSRQTPSFTSGIFSKLSGDKSHEPAPLFSKNFIDPKVEKNPTLTGTESSSTAQTFSFQPEISKQVPAFPFASSSSTDGLFSKSSPSSQLFGKKLEKSEPNVLFKKIGKDQQMSNSKHSRIKESKGAAISDKSLPSTSSENRHHIASQMDVKHLTTIICKGLHPDDNKKDILLGHFLKFGKVAKITCNLNQKHAIIQFTDHESASKAKRNGSLVSTIHNPVSIFWCQKGPSKNVKDPNVTRSEVDDELKSMLEGAGEHDLLVRPPKEKSIPHVTEQRTIRGQVKSSKPSTSKNQNKRAASPTASTSEETWAKALTQIANTPAERFTVLDSRDKLIRQSLEKHSDFKTKVISGTCPDMCPEKERYNRFTKNCLSLYEQTSDPLRLEHKVAVKEYSRSSADQEEPLPHELRPPETLALTLDYLLCNIMDRTEESMAIGEWYNFIWNRIRAVQKDIIQQDLCNTTCVEIVEKCVRFHIHCSATLCDKEMAVFDPKINNENLSKSLKTLKNFYTDLAANEIMCPNEPEFRAYDILLHLNEGNNTLRYVQNLRMEVRNSPEVRFAVSIAFAFTNNNYVRFFKYLSQATYFNACILHRYFSEIRVQALRIILKAYCRPNKKEQYPIEDLCALLKFENYSEAVHFCENIGLQTVENQHVVLDRLAFSRPTSLLHMSQAPIVVGSKKRTSLGEAINHKPLPENPLHHYKPHNSFDEKGYLKKESYQGLDQFIARKNPAALSRNTFKFDTCSSIPVSTLPEVTALPQPAVFSTSSLNSVSFKPRHNLFKSAIEKPILPIFPLVKPFIQPITNQEKEKTTMKDETCQSETFPKISFDIQHKQEQLKEVDVSTRESDANLTQHSKEVFQAVTNSVLNHVIQEMVRHVSTSTYTEELGFQQKLKKKVMEKISTSVLGELVAEVVQEEVTDIVRQDVVFHRKEKLNIVSRISLNILLEKSIPSFVEQIAKEVYETEEERWLTELENARGKVMLSRVRRAFWRWHKASIRKQQMETCRNTFPSCPILQFMVRSPTSHLLSTPLEASAVQNINARLLESGVLCKAIKEELSWMPLDLTTIFENAFNNDIKFPLLSATMNYWKVLLVYFEDNDIGPDFSLISQWVCAKFSKGCENVKLFAESKVCSLYWLTDLSNHRIAVCVRSIAINSETFQNNLSQLKKAALLDGTVAILACLPSKAMPNFPKGCHQQLEQLLEAKANVPSVPLYSLIIGPNPSFCDIARHWHLGMQEKRLISDFEICTLDLKEDFYQLSEKVSTAIDWLVQRCPKMPQFTTKYLKDYFQDGIVEVFNVIFQDISHKKNQNEFYQDPNAIISLFNESIKHRCFLVTSPSLNSISGPPPELIGFGKHSVSCKNPEFRQRLKTIMEAQILPQFNGYPLFREDALTFVEKIITSTNKNASNLLSSIDSLLHKSPRIGEREFLIPWSDVIYECVQFLYSNQIYSELTEEMNTMYLQEELKSLNLIRRWKEISESASVLEFCDSHLIDNEKVTSSACKRKLNDDCKNSLTPATSPLSEKRKKISELEVSLKTEKENSDAFSTMLQQAMDPAENLDDLPNTSQCYNDDLGSREPALADWNSIEKHEFSCSGDIIQQVVELEQNIESEKNATRAFNSTLQALLL